MLPLTICIPTRNRPQLLRTTLLSIIAGFETHPVIIIGDNGDANATRELLKESVFQQIQIIHIINPEGSTYIQNLQTLIQECYTEWLSILHDDDFWVGPVSKIIEPWLNESHCDFIFSDHYVANQHGQLLENESDQNSVRYGRSGLKEGIISNPIDAFIEQKVCLDGFFVRSSIAKSVSFNLDFQICADSLWLASLLMKCRQTRYTPQRLFAYRLTSNNLTGNTAFLHESHRMIKVLLTFPSLSLSARKHLGQRLFGITKVLFKRMLSELDFKGLVHYCRQLVGPNG